MRKINTKSKRGDTLIEVIFAITIFSVIAVGAVSLMNSGVNTAQSTLEITMARTEIAAQAEALRFIQNSYLAERQLAEESKQFTQLWDELALKYAREASELDGPNGILASFTNVSNCDDVYKQNGNMYNFKYFVINTRQLQPKLFDRYESAPDQDGTVTEQDYASIIKNMIVSAEYNGGNGAFQPPTLYPRIIYKSWNGNTSSSSEELKEDTMFGLNRMIQRVEGLWVVGVKSEATIKSPSGSSEPEFYDFYIRTCWNAPGKRVPSTIGTIIRLYNPKVID